MKGYLRDHVLMVHKGINPYTCDYCDKIFTQAHYMRTHMKECAKKSPLAKILTIYDISYFCRLRTMKYSVNTITLRSHLNSAMSDQIPWDMLLTIMESLCMTLDK